jgi:hypothetical protein
MDRMTGFPYALGFNDLEWTVLDFESSGRGSAYREYDDESTGYYVSPSSATTRVWVIKSCTLSCLRFNNAQINPVQQGAIDTI